MNIALVDDRAADREELAAALKEYAAVHGLSFGLSSFSGGEALLENFRPHAYGLIFLDVYMDGLSGVETAEIIRSVDEHVLLVFLTNSETHQSQAIHWHVFDYINKSEGREAVFRVMNRALHLRTEKEDPSLGFTADKTDYRLSYGDLVCLTADRNYLIITDRNGREYRTRMTFSSVREVLERDGRFLTILRGVIVNMDYITDIQNNTCVLRGQLRLPVSVRNRERIEQAWTSYTFSKIRRESMEGGC